LETGTGLAMHLLPPHYFGICLVATLILVVAIPAFPGLENARFIGPLLLAIGSWFVFVAHAAFQRRGTAINPFDTPKVLVTGGAFAISRNPMYLGFTLMIGGLGMLGATPWALIPCVVFFAIMNWQFIPREEANAEAAFGEAYRAYKASVRRWI
jgi:protein-S-isoprenylcysteine O-methyltransferase Ste14